MKNLSYLLLFFMIFFNQVSTAQSINNWQLKKGSEVSKTRLQLDKKTIPSKYRVLSLDFNALQTNLKSASKRSQNNKLASTLQMDFPLEDGTMESFSLEKTSVLAPELEAKYPEIQSFYGVSTKNPLNKIYISTSPEGFTGIITGNKTIYIDPVSKNDTSNYIVYDRKDCSRNPDDSFVCNAIMEDTKSDSKTSSNAKTASTTDGNLRTYRLALACTSAYSLYYGNTVAQVLAAMNTTITRVNSVYRRDLSVVFQLVANNDRLIYINGFNIDASPDPDPYDNYNGSGMLSINTANITGLIGVGAYDIGHVFSTGGGGIAGTGPCTAASKGNGVTGIVTPQFDPFDIDYVCHEIGHQFGAGHTYYNACFGSKVSDDYEPGSASTIMGYAGICAPNVQGNSDAYFHARSIEQMTTAISGHSCVTGTSSGNAAPVVAALTARTIPKSTPFILTGSATDTNTADLLTYTWEQYNNDGTYTQPPTASNAGGPIFRSFMPTSDPSRTFPNLAAVINNTTPTWEVLPSVARTLNFRLTVRDNSTLGGRTNFQAVTITVGTAGPFAVTAPNTGSEIWYVGETKAVTWNVASTNTATYSTTVNIKLSTDGGYTYPITLASGVANSGTANITVPDNVGKLNRIKVEAAANIFFDLSNANFEIKSGKFELTSAASTQSVCKPSDAVYTINYTPAPTFSETTTFSAVGAPAGATITFSPTTRSTSGTFTMTVSNTSGVAAGNYPITIKGTSATANIDFPALLNVFDNTIGNLTLSSPSNGATNQQTSSLLQWNALSSASSYLVQISTSPTFATITESATVTTTSYQTTALAAGTINYWRVQPINTCISGAFSEVYSFQIASDLCKTYSNVTFEPNAVWETNSNNAVSAKINIPDNINISKVSFYMKATHPLLSDIKMQFSGPTGIFAEIYNRDCSGANFDVTFDDNGTPLTCGNVDPLTTAGLEGIQQASQSLSKFNGSSSLGTWTLLATDRVSNTSGGTFTNFSITVCGKLQIVNNIAVTNNTLSLNQGATSNITQLNLLATQPTATTTQLVYVITKLPTNGTLKLNNVAMVVGGTFTQTDINNNLLSYTNNGINSNPDSFKFSVNGINLAILGGQTYNITVNSPICTAPIPDQINLPAVNAQCSVSPTAPTATSNCYGQITGTTLTTFPITTQGTTVITWTYDDGNGQTSTQTQNVIINSTLVPALPNITAQCSVTPNAPTATVFCNETLTGTTTSTFPITTQGTTIVTWTFDDGNGNTTTQTQNVIIDDTTAPVADIASLPNVTGQNSVTVNAPTATDACKGTVTATTTSPLTYSTPGTYSIVWTYDDENGNTSTQNQTVIVLDAIAPTQPTSLSASGTTTTTTNLTWTASTDNVGVIGYDVYRGTTLIATVAATNYAVTGLTANTAYTFSVIAKDAAGNTSISSNIANVTTLANAVVYCTSKGTSTTREKIGKVVLGSINNTSTSTAGYENFTAIATNATRGTAYTITITPSWTSSKRSEGYAVRIDYNADGDFTDTGELVFSKAASTTTPISGTFTIPTTATIGATRMRVSMKYNGIPTACETFASGQVEDYTVTIVSNTARIAAKTNDSVSSTILVYPNPTTGILNVTETSSTATYIIYNLLGQSIMKGNLSNTIIDVSNITTGNYLLEITDNGNITSKRIIKQ